MSSRKRRTTAGSQRATKRRRTGIGARQPDDDIPIPQAQADAPTASALSVRTLRTGNIPTLSTICVRVLSENLKNLSDDEESKATWEQVRDQLKRLPDELCQKVFTGLKNNCPSVLNHGHIVVNFLRGSSISLYYGLPSVGRRTIFAIGDMQAKDKLREIELTGFFKIADDVFASTISRLPSLQKLNLRGCSKVSQKTVLSAAIHCPNLEILNINYTAVPPASLAPLLKDCKRLKVLKTTGIPQWTDATCSKLWAELGAGEGFPLLNIRSLKLRQAPLGDATINPVLAACPNLRRLDLSFTNIKHPILPAGNLLEKLVLNSTRIANNELVNLIKGSPNLKYLAIGAMGGGQGSGAAISNSSAMTMTDESLRSLTEALEGCPNLERVNLVGNTKLGFAGRRGPDAALASFIRRVGRRCKHLNLSGITSLRSDDLEGLVHPDDVADGMPQLTYLNLHNTSVDDTAAPYISACTHLQTLDVSGTKFSSAGLFPVIDACQRLEGIDLTSCRGVKVGDRRRFFEVWQEEWQNT